MTMNLKQTASKYLDLFEFQKQEDGTEITVFKAPCFQQGTPEFELYGLLSDPQLDLLNRLTTNFVNKWTSSALKWLTSCADVDQARNELQDAADSVADCHSGPQLYWFSRHVYHIYFLTQALEETDTTDAFEAIQTAQYIAIRQVFRKILDFIEKEMDREED